MKPQYHTTHPLYNIVANGWEKCVCVLQSNERTMIVMADMSDHGRPVTNHHIHISIRILCACQIHTEWKKEYSGKLNTHTHTHIDNCQIKSDKWMGVVTRATNPNQPTNQVWIESFAPVVQVQMSCLVLLSKCLKLKKKKKKMND